MVGAGGGGSGGRRGPVRFAVVDGFAGRRSVLPFALLVLGVLFVGLVLLLLINTALDQGAFALQAAQQRGTALTNQEQQLQQQLAATSAPGALASEAAGLGLVPNPQPAFLNPSSGAVLGDPSPAPSPSRPPSPSPSASPSVSPSATVSATASPVPTAGSPRAGAAPGAPTATAAPRVAPSAAPAPAPTRGAAR